LDDRVGLASVKGDPSVAQAYVAIASQDQVIEHRKMEEPSGGDCLGGQVEVVG
jgi:hypothetical protein